MSRILMSEEEKSRILKLHVEAIKTVSEQVSTAKAGLQQPKGNDEFAYALKQYGNVQQLRNVKPGAKVMAQGVCIATTSDASFAFVIPQGSTFTGMGNLLIGTVYRVDKTKLDRTKLNNPQYLSGVVANKQNFGMVAAKIGLTQDGTVLYPNGDSPLMLVGDSGQKLSQMAAASFA